MWLMCAVSYIPNIAQQAPKIRGAPPLRTTFFIETRRLGLPYSQSHRLSTDLVGDAFGEEGGE